MNGENHYDPKKVRLIINGIDIVGFSDDDKISIEPVTKEEYKSFAGVDGDVSFAKVNDDRVIISFSLQAESPSVIVIDTMRKLPTGHVVGIMNTSAAKYIGGSTNCRFSEKPSIKFPKENPKIEYKLLAPNWSGMFQAA